MDSNLPFILAWLASVPGIHFQRITEISISNLTFNTLSMGSVALQNFGFSKRESTSIIQHKEQHPPEELKAWCEKHNVSVICQRDPNYPQLLLQIPDPPQVLYVKGKLPNDDLPKIAVVGTRNITAYGKQVTKELTTQLVSAGCVIVSGFMYGVDAVAHQTAIDNEGMTIGVLGYGFDVPYYPRTHDKLATKLLDAGGCLLTEYPPWQHALARNFPKRNRIVAGLTLGVLVTEAAAKSGSKITARLAAEQGREVFAVPGPINSPYSEGTKELVNLGAKLVSHANDILEELRLPTHSSFTTIQPHFSSALEEQVYTLLQQHFTLSIQELLQYSLSDARILSQTLSNLELMGVIESEGNGDYSIRK